MKKNIIILIVLLVILVVVSLTAMITTRKRHREIIINKPRTQIFELIETNVGKYDLKFDDTPIEVEKINNVWMVTKPNMFKADQMEAFANVKNFNTLNIDSKITNLNEVSSFGLDTPSAEFSVWDGDKKHTIFVGSKTPDGERYYIKYNDEYFSVEWVYIEALKKSVDMLRDKDFLNIGFDEVVSVKSDMKGYTNIITKVRGTNWVVDGIEDLTDVGKAYQDFATLSGVKASGFVYDKGKDDVFKNTDAYIEINLEDRTKKRYGLALLNDKVYLRVDGDTNIYEVDFSIYDAAMRDKEYYIKTDKEEKSSDIDNMIENNTDYSLEDTLKK